MVCRGMIIGADHVRISILNRDKGIEEEYPLYGLSEEDIRDFEGLEIFYGVLPSGELEGFSPAGEAHHSVVQAYEESACNG